MSPAELIGLDVAYFPKLKRRIVFSKTGINAVDECSLRPMAFENFFVKGDDS